MRLSIGLFFLAVPLWAGCASVHREIPFTGSREDPSSAVDPIPIALGRVRVGGGGILRSAVYWKPGAFTTLPLPAEKFREKAEKQIEIELERSGFGPHPFTLYSLEVTIEELALFTRGEENEGYRQGYARVHFILRHHGVEVFQSTQEGEARFAGSRVRKSPESTLFRPLYIYDRREPAPLDYAVQRAVRKFLGNLPSNLPP